MVKAFRPTTKQVSALIYLRNRFYLSLKRRGLTLAKDTEKIHCNELTLLIDYLTGQQRLKL